MSTKTVFYTIAGVAVVGTLGFFAWKKWGSALVASSSDTSASTDAAPMSSGSVAATPSFNAASQSYTALPIGVNVGASNNSPPGIPAAQISTAPTNSGNAVVSPSDYGPSAADVSNAANQQVTNSTGHAAQPTDAISSAPGLTGDAAIIDSEYVKLFGRHAEQAGLDFWGNAMNAGVINANNLENNLIRGAQNGDIAAAATRNPNLYVAAFQQGAA